MIWFIFYCLLCIPFFLIGLNVLDLGWFWNGVFSLLSSGSLTFGMIRVIRSRLCPYRVKKSIKSNKKTKYIRVIIEKAFGKKPHVGVTNNVEAIVIFAYIPLVILLLNLLEPVVDSVFLRVFLGLILAIPCDLVLSVIVYRAAAQKAMLNRAVYIVRGHSEEMWREMKMVWNKQIKTIKQTAEKSADQIRTKKYSAKRETSLDAKFCTRCNKEVLLTEKEVINECHSSGINISCDPDIGWGPAGPMLTINNLTACGFNDIYELLSRVYPNKARALQIIIGKWAPWGRCPKCKALLCDECVSGLLPNYSLTEKPNCDCIRN